MEACNLFKIQNWFQVLTENFENSIVADHDGTKVVQLHGVDIVGLWIFGDFDWVTLELLEVLGVIGLYCFQSLNYNLLLSGSDLNDLMVYLKLLEDLNLSFRESADIYPLFLIMAFGSDQNLVLMHDCHPMDLFECL